MSAGNITIDILSNGEAWFGANCIASKSSFPELNAARSLRALNINLDAPLAIRKIGVVVRHTTAAFILRSDLDNAAVTHDRQD